jgi:hypothetical protein
LLDGERKFLPTWKFRLKQTSHMTTAVPLPTTPPPATGRGECVREKREGESGSGVKKLIKVLDNAEDVDRIITAARSPQPAARSQRLMAVT